MIALLEQHQDQIAQLCRQLHVVSLQVFGSATSRDRFNESTSDIDLLVEFEDDLQPAQYAECFFQLTNTLESLLGRKIDLITTRSLTNPYFSASVAADAEPLFAA